MNWTIESYCFTEHQWYVWEAGFSRKQDALDEVSVLSRRYDESFRVTVQMGS